MSLKDRRTLSPLTEKQNAAYQAMVDQSAGPDACWPWKGRVTAKGYGEFCTGGIADRVKCRAHRMAYFLEHGVDPGSLWVLHKCDNPPCCNPKHLWLGNNTDNNRDSAAKGRKKWKEDHLWRQHPDSVLHGERNGHSKLTEVDVVEIRRLHAEGLHKDEIAAKFGVTPTSIRYIVERKQWKRVP